MNNSKMTNVRMGLLLLAFGALGVFPAMAQDAPDVIALRLSAAREEISHVAEFNYVIINDQFGEALKDLTAVVRAQRLRLDAQMARHGELINRMMK